MSSEEELSAEYAQLNGGYKIDSTLYRDLIAVLRPRQWVKNVFVLAPILFSETWTEQETFISITVALLCFCAWSSSVYCLNDVLDASADRAHPRKRKRPIAAGRISAGTGVALAVLLSAMSFAVALFSLPIGFSVVGALYLGNSLAYCLVLKYFVIADVLVIAVGFVLRLEGGCQAIGVMPSPWLVLCGFSVALVFGFGKRRLECDLPGNTTEYRPTLANYTPEKLNLLLGVTVAVSLMAYMLYTVAPGTVRIHNTDRLVYTVLFVAYGLFRFVFRVQEGRDDGPDDILLGDHIFILNGILWVLSVAIVLATA